MKNSKNIQINFLNQNTPTNKTEKTVADVFRAAGQIMYNYYTLVLKKDPKIFKSKRKRTIKMLK
ncbi:MAG: hypothetical protein ABH873_03970 [Candidatus Firestonebacteria bacterium]